MIRPLALLPLLLALLLPASASAQLAPKLRPDVRGEVLAALLPLARPGSHLPVTVELSAGPAGFDGVLLVDCGEDCDGPPARRAVSVGRNATQRLVLPYRLPGWTRSLRVRALDPRGRAVDLTVAGEDGEDPRVRDEDDPPGAVRLRLGDAGWGGSDLHVAIFGEEPLGWTTLRTVHSGPVPGHPEPSADSEPRGVKVATLLPEAAPERWYALDLVDIVVWRRPDPARLSPEQQEALRGWVAAGGTLVLAFGPEHRTWSGSPLGTLLPLDGREVAPSAEALFEVIARAPVAHPNGEGSLPVLRLASPSPEVAWTAADGLPLALLHEAGAGRAIGLLFDPMAAELKGFLDREAFWRALLALPAEDTARAPPSLLAASDERPCAPPTLGASGRHFDPGDHASWLSTVRAQLGEFEGSAPLSVGFLLVFAALYLLAIGPVDRIVVRRLGRPLLAWMTFPAVSLLFSAFVVGTVTLRKGEDSQLACWELVEPLPGAGARRGSTWCALWTGGRLELEIGNERGKGWVGSAAPVDASGWLDTPESLGDDLRGVADGADLGLSFRSRQWAVGHVESAWVEPDRGRAVLREARRVRGGGLRGGVVHNELDLDLRSAVVVRDGQFWELGDLDRGARVELPVDGGRPLTSYVPDGDRVSAAVAALSGGRANGADPVGGGCGSSPLLLGVLDAPLGLPEFGGLPLGTRRDVVSILRTPLVVLEADR